MCQVLGSRHFCHSSEDFGWWNDFLNDLLPFVFSASEVNHLLFFHFLTLTAFLQQWRHHHHLHVIMKSNFRYFVREMCFKFCRKDDWRWCGWWWWMKASKPSSWAHHSTFISAINFHNFSTVASVFFSPERSCLLPFNPIILAFVRWKDGLRAWNRPVAFDCCVFVNSCIFRPFDFWH